MGFSSILDILGSVIIGGFLLLILFRLSNTSTENTYLNGSELIIQQNLVEVVELLEYDFRKIGYCEDWTKIPDPSQAILSADSNDITYLTDVDSDGLVDTVRYFTGTTEELSVTDNPSDVILYRLVNGETPAGSNLGVTQFQLIYFNAVGDTIDFPIQVPGEIYTMQINITIENTTGYDNQYTAAFWRQIRLAARNLKNR